MAFKRKRFIKLLTFIVMLIIKTINTSDSDKQADSSGHQDNLKKNDIEISIFEEINAFRIRSSNELDLISEVSDLTFLKFFYKRSSEKAIKIAQYIKSISERLQDIFAVALIDCDTFTPKNHKDCVEYEYVKDSFPRMKLLIPPKDKWNMSSKKLEPHSEYPWTEKEMTEESIYNYITSNMPYLGIKLRENNYEPFLNNDFYNKVILFTEKKESQVIWKGLSNYFYDRILFAEVNKDAEEIVYYFGVKKFPTVMVYKVIDRKRLVDEPENIVYESNFEIKKLIEWIEPHANVEKRYNLQMKNLGDPSAEEIAKNLELRKLEKGSYETYLNKHSDKNILIYFDTKSYRIKTSIKQYIVSTHGYFLSAFFDCSTDKSFCLEKFNVTKFPKLKLLPKHDNITISNIDQRIKNIHSLDISKSTNKTLADQISEIFPSKVQNTTALEFPYLISESRFKKNFIIAHLYKSSEKNISHLFPLDLISRDEKISQYFDFYSVENPLIETIKMHKFPSSSGLFFMYLGAKEQYMIHQVSRDVFYASLNSIANNFIFYITHAYTRADFHSDIVVNIETNAALKKNCLDEELCILAFFDVRPGNDKILSFSNDIQKLENIKINDRKFENIRFNWVNATCHNYLGKLFNVKLEQLPGIVVIYGWRNSYATYNGYWDNFPLNNFLERAISNRYDTKNFVRDTVVFKNKDCEYITDPILMGEKFKKDKDTSISNNTKVDEKKIYKEDIDKVEVIEKNNSITEKLNYINEDSIKTNKEQFKQEIKSDL